MGHRIRHYEPGVYYYEVVAKCCGDEMLLRPDPMALGLIALALSIACREHPCIRVIAFQFLSNHYHMVLAVADDADAPRISRFLKTLNETIAKRLNFLRGRDGHFFRGKPSVLPILDDAAVADRMTYTHAQAVHHGLVERAEDWIGLSSFRAVCEGKSSIEVPFFDEKAWRKGGSLPDAVEAFTITISIPISNPMKWDRLSARELRAARQSHEESVRDRERAKRAERKAQGDLRALPNASTYAKTDPYSRPAGLLKRSPKPWAHGSKRAVAEYRERYSETRAVHKVASAKFRATGKLGKFPTGTFAPWSWDVPTRP
jgi:REP element-mobilizing transposase RayT